MNKIMTPEEFKKRWESDEFGGGITCDDCADCYTAWGLGDRPRYQQIQSVIDTVLKFAKVNRNK